MPRQFAVTTSLSVSALLLASACQTGTTHGSRPSPTLSPLGHLIRCGEVLGATGEDLRVLVRYVDSLFADRTRFGLRDLVVTTDVLYADRSLATQERALQRACEGQFKSTFAYIAASTAVAQGEQWPGVKVRAAGKR